MYKQASRFRNRLNGGKRRGRFNTNLVSTTDVQTVRPHKGRPPGAKRPDCGARVYLVRLTPLNAGAKSILKIGMSSMALAARFQADLPRYTMEALASSRRLSGRDTIALEKAIHAAFCASRVVPEIRLRSGNTECYADTDANLCRFVDIVNEL